VFPMRDIERLLGRLASRLVIAPTGTLKLFLSIETQEIIIDFIQLSI
jgi:hypothetical protein